MWRGRPDSAVWPAATAALLVGACAERPPVLVLDHAAWTLVAREDDPWAAPPDATCHEGSGRAEEGYFEVSTEACSWGTWTQPALIDGEDGDRWEVELFHLDLWASSPATAVVELALGSQVVLSWSSPIPAAAGRFDLEGEAPGVGEASAAYLHVHNHGLNSYRIGDVVAYGRR